MHYREIALVLGCRDATARSHMHLALKNLRDAWPCHVDAPSQAYAGGPS
jgi:DNA-directed RNA polymerase specialized sigma24 family protein